MAGRDGSEEGKPLTGLQKLLVYAGVALGALILLGGVAYLAFSAFGSIFKNDPENVKMRQESKTDRKMISKAASVDKTEIRTDEKTDRKVSKTCKKVACTKKFLFWCTDRNAKQYTECIAAGGVAG